MGAIPIVEHSAMDRTFEGLPVLLVDSYADLSEDMLNVKWEEMTCHPEKYDWQRLTLTYWHDLIASVIRTASSHAVQKNHPIRLSGGPACFTARADWLGTAGIDDIETLK